MNTDISFGPGVFYIGDKPIGTGILVDDVDTLFPRQCESTVNVPITIPSLSNRTCDVEFEFKGFMSDIPTLIDHEPKNFTVEYDTVRIEQIRKHKKRRINKKWAKRYGYREVSYKCRIANARLSVDNTIEFSPHDIKYVRGE